MANQQNRKGRSRHGPPFVALRKYMLNSPAWIFLSPVARAAYVELECVYNGANNGSLAMSVRRLSERLGRKKNTAARALRELDDAGFIEPVSMGTFSRKNRRATEYRLTVHRCDLSGHRPSMRFMQWAPPDPQSRQKDRTVSPRGHAQQNNRSQSRQRDRRGENRASHSPTTGTHIESNHGGVGDKVIAEQSTAMQLAPHPNWDGLDIPVFLDRRCALAHSPSEKSKH